MHYQNIATIGIVALALAAGEGEGAGVSRDPPARPPAGARPAEFLPWMSTRHLEKRSSASDGGGGFRRRCGHRMATRPGGLKEDVTNVNTAVNDLRTTTPENGGVDTEAENRWTAGEIEADVSRLAGKVTSTPPQATTRATGENVSTEARSRHAVIQIPSRPACTGRRDPAGTRRVKARGAQETEIEDTRARVKKLGDDVDRLRSASADDWWDVTKARVNEYVDRVEASLSG